MYYFTVGTNCEINIDDCVPDLCQNGGTCEDGVNLYTCLCPSGFEGDYCEDNRNECILNVCVNYLNCVDLVSIDLGIYLF